MSNIAHLQISKALLGDDQRIKLPRFLEEDAPKDPEQTKQVRRSCGCAPAVNAAALNQVLLVRYC